MHKKKKFDISESLPQDDVYYAAHSHASKLQLLVNIKNMINHATGVAASTPHKPVSFPLLYAIIATKRTHCSGVFNKDYTR